MKHAQKIILATVLAMSCSIHKASAQIFVNIRPARVVTVRTVAPAPRQVWIEEDWRENDGRYEWSGGHWEAPPRENVRYRNGHWRHSNRGDQWVRGSWYNSARPAHRQEERREERHDNGRGRGNGNGKGHGNGHKNH